MALALGELYGKLSLDNKEFNKGLNQAETALQDFGSKGKVLAGAAGAAIGAALAAGLVKAVNVEAANDKVAASLGLNKKQAERAGKVAGSLFSKAYGASMEDVSGAVEAVMSSVKGMRNATAPQIEAMTRRVLDMAAAFEIDAGRAAQVAGQMINSGLAKNGKQAVDLLTASLQRVPKNVREDLLDAADEYGPFFAQMGISGEKAMSMLVKSSEKGMYGIDKTGDAIKEFTIRATDMSKTTGEAYDILGMDQQKMTNALLAGGEKGADAFQKIIGGLQDIKDPAKRSQAALALFGTPLEDLSVGEIPKFLSGLQKTEGRLGKVSGATDRMGKTLNDNAKTRITEFTRKLQTAFVQMLGDKVIPAINSAVSWINKNMIPAFKAVSKWVKDNQVWLGALATGVLAYIAAVKTMAAVGFVTGLIKKMAAAQWGLNAAMRANPIGLIVAAIAALVAGAILAYNKVEWFRKAVDKAWAWIKKVINGFVQWFKKTAWPWMRNILQWLGDKIMWLWKNVVKPAFKKIGQFIGWAWRTLIKPALKGIWAFITDILVPVIQWLWKKVVKPVFKALGKFIGWVWANLIKPAFKALDKFISDVIVPTVRWLWKKVIKPAFRGIGNFIEWAWDKLIKPAFKAIDKFITGTLAPTAKWLWKKVIKPAFEGIGGAIEWAWDKVIKPVFQALKKFITKTIPNAFDSGVKNVKKFWNGLKAIAKKPIKFMIDTVYNKGIRGVFNNVMDFVGSDMRLPRLNIKGFRKGGYTGDGDKNAVAGVTHGQEYVVNAEATKQIRAKHPGLLEGMNSKGAAAIGNGSGGLAANGFVVNQDVIWGPFQAAIKRMGRLFVSGNPSGWSVPAATGMWDGLSRIDTKYGRGAPQASVSAFPFINAGNKVGFAFGDGGITLNSSAYSMLGPSLRQAVSAHEIGHILGLPHTGAASIMQPTIGKHLSPTPFDKRTLESLYGEGSRAPGGGGGFNPLGWLVDNGLKLLTGFLDKIPGSGAFVDMAQEIAKSVISSIKDWALNKLGGGEDPRDKGTSTGTNKFGATVPTLMDGGGWLRDNGGTPTLVDHSRRKPDAFTPYDQWKEIVDHAGNSGVSADALRDALEGVEMQMKFAPGSDKAVATMVRVGEKKLVRS